MYCYPATLVPHPLHLGRYDVTFVDFPGCISSGDTLEQALVMAQEALHLHLCSMLADGDPIPAPSTLDSAVRADDVEAGEENAPQSAGAIWQYILVEPSPGRAKAEAPVRLSISLTPSVIEKIDAIADDMGLTRSGVISAAAREYIDRRQG
jgi:predicted RNase H-like HicB family nuclease